MDERANILLVMTYLFTEWSVVHRARIRLAKTSQSAPFLTRVCFDAGFQMKFNQTKSKTTFKHKYLLK